MSHKTMGVPFESMYSTKNMDYIKVICISCFNTDYPYIILYQTCGMN